MWKTIKQWGCGYISCGGLGLLLNFMTLGTFENIFFFLGSVARRKTFAFEGSKNIYFIKNSELKVKN